MIVDPSLVRLMGFGVVAVLVGGPPGIAIITTMTSIEAYYKRKKRRQQLQNIMDEMLIHETGKINARSNG